MTFTVMALGQHPEILERYVCSNMQTQLDVNFKMNFIARIIKKIGSVPNKFQPPFQNKQFPSTNISKMYKKKSLRMDYFSFTQVIFFKAFYITGPKSHLIQLPCTHIASS